MKDVLDLPPKENMRGKINGSERIVTMTIGSAHNCENCNALLGQVERNGQINRREFKKLVNRVQGERAGFSGSE